MHVEARWPSHPGTRQVEHPLNSPLSLSGISHFALTSNWISNLRGTAIKSFYKHLDLWQFSIANKQNFCHLCKDVVVLPVYLFSKIKIIAIIDKIPTFQTAQLTYKQVTKITLVSHRPSVNPPAHEPDWEFPCPPSSTQGLHRLQWCWVLIAYRVPPALKETQARNTSSPVLRGAFKLSFFIF